MLDLTPIRERCERATPGPWHYCPCGEKSNDCILGVAYGEKGQPPPGRVELHPYDEKTGKYDMWSLDIEEIASRDNHARYDDFAFCAHARTDIPALCDEVEALRAEVARLTALGRS